MTTRRTNAERSEETRAGLMAAARTLFIEQGYAATPLEAIVERTRMTRGALYHHFKDKAALFRAVFAETDQSMHEAIARSMEKAEGDEWQRVMAAVHTFLKQCSTPDVQHILYVDGPSVLGVDWPSTMGLSLIRQSIALLMSQGYLAVQPVEPLIHLIHGNLAQAAIYIARADDQLKAREEIESALQTVFAGLRIRA